MKKASTSIIQKNNRRYRTTKLFHGKEAKAAAVFLLPSLLGSCLFYFFPFASTIRRSFFNTTGSRFVGIENYSTVFENEAFQLAASNTARFTAVCIPVLLLISLLFAMMFRFLHPTGRKLKSFYLVPMAIPVVSIALIWQVLFDNQGILNYALASSGRDMINFINSSAAFWLLIGTYIWKNLGYNIVLWIAGLDTISDQLYDAAQVDGAGVLARFRYVTLPGLFPVISMVTTLSILNSFKVFREVYLVAGNYPNDSIYQLQHLFNNWFADLSLNNLSTAATLLCMVLLLVILLLHYIFRPRS